MKAALIAAGRGERLHEANIDLPKPLVPVAGKPLIDHVLDAVAVAGIRELACIFNAEDDAVEEHVRRRHAGFQLQIVRCSTPSSMESLFALQPHLPQGRFLLLTVDAVFGPSLLPEFLRAAAWWPDAAGVLAVHGFADDEKPLRVAIDGAGRITALGSPAADSPLITAGLYVLNASIFREVAAARAAHLSALRQFLGLLLEQGHSLYAAAVAKTVDVDRPVDLAEAEAFVRSGYRA